MKLDTKGPKASEGHSQTLARNRALADVGPRAKQQPTREQILADTEHKGSARAPSANRDCLEPKWLRILINVFFNSHCIRIEHVWMNATPTNKQKLDDRPVKTPPIFQLLARRLTKLSTAFLERRPVSLPELQWYLCPFTRHDVALKQT